MSAPRTAGILPALITEESADRNVRPTSTAGILPALIAEESADRNVRSTKNKKPVRLDGPLFVVHCQLNIAN